MVCASKRLQSLVRDYKALGIWKPILSVKGVFDNDAKFVMGRVLDFGIISGVSNSFESAIS